MKRNNANNDSAANAAAATDERTTIAGAVPPGLEKLFRAAPAPMLPEVCKLPPPRRRCIITGASRSWLLEAHERAKQEGRGFIFRVRQPGRVRGACFLNVRRLLDFMRAEEAADHAIEAAGAEVKNQRGPEVQP